MHNLILSISIFAFTCAYAFGLAGLLALIPLDEHEMEALKERQEIARKKGWLAQLLFLLERKFDYENLQETIDHWQARPGARRAIYIAASCLVLAIGLMFALRDVS